VRLAMDAELQKLVESGKLSSKAAEQLEELRPGAYCLHKSWGFGRVAEWNLLLNQIVIDFTGKKKHPMQLQYAAENLAPLASDHFLARKAADPASIKKLVKEDAPAVVRSILESLGGKGTVQQISQWLIGDLFTEPEWKRWWESAKKALKKDGSFVIPAKKNEPIQIRTTPVSHANELIESFNQARQPKEQAAALDQIVKLYSEFKEPEKQLQAIVNTAENVAARHQKLHPEFTFELVIARDDLLERLPQLRSTHVGMTLSKLVVDEEKRLMSILPKLPAAKEKRVLQALPSALGERWTARALQMMQMSHGRMVAQIPRILSEAGQHAELRAMLERSIREHSATSEMLIWLTGDRENWADLITPALLGAILSALEREQHIGTGRGSKLNRALVDDRQLIGDIFAKAEVGIARDAMRKLLLSPLFDELTKRSLLARIVKLYPELEGMITGGQPAEKSEALVVSWSSLEKRRAEYEELVNKKIPENSKEIGVARSYGDLRENFEFKAAKQMQAVLMRRKAELESALDRARGTAFENPDTSRVSIGTVVTVREAESKKEETYAILGAWDGDPDRQIISYQTAIGQALLGHKVGEVVTLNSDQGTGRYAIVSIEAAPRDKATPDPSLSDIPAEAVAVE
jgi:transcription elongation GreA/GreB family factor